MQTKEDIGVLIIDDSALMRNLIARIVQSSPGLTVLGTAMNGRFALTKIPTFKPDVIVLDLEMPEMNGIDLLKELKARKITIPVVILSSIAKKGAAVTLEALNLGACDFVTKPSGAVSEDIGTIAGQLTDLLHYFGNKYQKEHPLSKRELSPEPLGFDASQTMVLPKRETSSDLEQVPHFKPENKPGKLEVIAIGISTGGPSALRRVFAELSKDLTVPILVVQHMPAGFTTEFAKSLDRICGLEVKEASDGDLIIPGRIFIAPGDHHIKVEHRSLGKVIRLDKGSNVNGHRPSADVLFASVAEVYGNRALGLIMTGMGRDGARNLGLIYKAGGITLAQDEASSVVFGMPRVAYEYGYVHEQVALSAVAGTIGRYASELTG